MRLKLKTFRVSKNLTQAEMAEKIGCSLNSYQGIEKGRRTGNMKFWNSLKDTFCLTGNELIDLMEETDNNEPNRTKSDSPTN